MEKSKKLDPTVLYQLPSGFEWGPVLVTRVAKDTKKGWVVVELKSQKDRVQVYVTKTGKIRVYNKDKELLPKEE